ncbi:MAG: hypothetical protein PVF87_02225 [Acidimicrobiia bacterium]|jgi:hypothetical protein
MYGTLLERRDELIVERRALIEAMKRMKTLFVATFAEELPHRWEWLAKSWLDSLESPVPPELMVGYQPDLETLQYDARSIAQRALNRTGVWGHEESLPAISTKRPYARIAPGPRWSHLSPAMEEAEEHVLAMLESRFDPHSLPRTDLETGVLSEALVETATIYAGSFARLQKVDLALKRLKEQAPRPRPGLKGEDGFPRLGR